MKYKDLFVSATAILLLMSGCSTASSAPRSEISQTPTEAQTTPTQSPTETQSATSTPTPAASTTTRNPSDQGCRAATPQLLNSIASLAQNGTGMKAVRGYSLKSPDFSKVYFIAMEFSATGIENQTGVWVSNELDGSGMIMSVDGLAKEFTEWFHSDDSDAAISLIDPSYQRVMNCMG